MYASVAASYSPADICMPAADGAPALIANPLASLAAGSKVLVKAGQHSAPDEATGTQASAAGGVGDGPSSWASLLQRDQVARAALRAESRCTVLFLSLALFGYRNVLRWHHLRERPAARPSSSKPSQGKLCCRRGAASGGSHASKLAYPGLLAAAAVDASAALTKDGPRAHFAGGAYRPSLFYTRQLDMLSLAALAALQQLWPQPGTVQEAAQRGVLNALILLAVVWFVATRNPFFPEDAWQLYVKVGSLLLAVLVVALTHFGYAFNLRYGAGPDASAQAGYQEGHAVLTALSYTVVVGCVLLALTLAIGFCSHTITGARRLQLIALLRARKQSWTNQRTRVTPKLHQRRGSSLSGQQLASAGPMSAQLQLASAGFTAPKSRVSVKVNLASLHASRRLPAVAHSSAAQASPAGSHTTTPAAAVPLPSLPDAVGMSAAADNSLSVAEALERVQLHDASADSGSPRTAPRRHKSFESPTDGPSQVLTSTPPSMSLMPRQNSSSISPSAGPEPVALEGHSSRYAHRLVRASASTITFGPSSLLFYRKPGHTPAAFK